MILRGKRSNEGNDETHRRFNLAPEPIGGGQVRARPVTRKEVTCHLPRDEDVVLPAKS